MYKSIHVIVNPAAGQDYPVLKVLNNALQSSDMDWHISVTRGKGDGRRFVQQALDEGVDVVGVYGGDGTVAEVAGSLNGTDIPLAIFPGGTGNVLAHELGIPRRIEKSLELVTSRKGVIRDVDLGQVGEHAFLVGVVSGIMADMVVKSAETDLKDNLGFLAYPLTVLQSTVETKPSRYTLTIDGERVETRGVTALIANCINFRIGAISMAPTVDLSDGLLDVIIVRAADIPSIVAIAAGAASPEKMIPEPLQHWRAREVTFEADPVQNLSYDGETLPRGPVTVKVLPRAIKVVVPA